MGFLRYFWGELFFFFFNPPFFSKNILNITLPWAFLRVSGAFVELCPGFSMGFLWVLVLHFG